MGMGISKSMSLCEVEEERERKGQGAGGGKVRSEVQLGRERTVSRRAQSPFASQRVKGPLTSEVYDAPPAAAIGEYIRTKEVSDRERKGGRKHELTLLRQLLDLEKGDLEPSSLDGFTGTKLDSL